jgi:flagellar hook-basal body complex protein FliE
MNVTLKPFDFAQAVARAGLTTNGQPIDGPKAAAGTGFQQALTQALGAVSESQNQATRLQREVQLDNPTVSLEETMVAMQKAQLGFQATLQVRNRLVQAYSDIMNMQVCAIMLRPRGWLAGLGAARRRASLRSGADQNSAMLSLRRY